MERKCCLLHTKLSQPHDVVLVGWQFGCFDQSDGEIVGKVLPNGRILVPSLKESIYKMHFKIKIKPNCATHAVAFPCHTKTTRHKCKRPTRSGWKGAHRWAAKWKWAAKWPKGIWKWTLDLNIPVTYVWWNTASSWSARSIWCWKNVWHKDKAWSIILTSVSNILYKFINKNVNLLISKITWACLLPLVVKDKFILLIFKGLGKEQIL